jgi:hydroxyacylglutathione hydrolase
MAHAPSRDGDGMIFQQFLNEDSGCLSYLIGCGDAGEAIVVDPGRDRVNEYLRFASKKGMKITRVVETHTHADHISGGRDLRAASGASILVHPASGALFEHGTVRDGDELAVGDVRVKVMHTPGHTPDSLSLLVTDLARGKEPWFVLTGDLLFVGSVGRPDLGGATAAGDIYDSLTRVLLPLDDLVEVYPAHGSGSSCGKAMSAKSGSTIGFERRFNPALQVRERNAFVDFIMTGIPPKPAAFETIVAKNRGVLPLISAKPRPYGAREAWEAVRGGAIVVDLRDPATYGEGHVAGAINVWIDSPQFAERVAAFVTPGTPLLLMAQGPSDVDQAVIALTRVGIDDIVGFLQWGMIEWKSEGLPTDSVPQITVYDLAAWRTERPELVVIDVREPAEWMAGHIDGALHLPMLEIVKRIAEVPTDRPKAVVCAGGLRSSTVISALQHAGRHDFYNVTGGMSAWTRAGYTVSKTG